MSCMDSEFESMIGLKKLSAVWRTRNDSSGENGIGFVLDNVAYIAWEDESDGYRSCMDRLQKEDGVVVPDSAFFAEQSVMATAEEDGNLLILTCVISGKQVMSVGTINYDDYYPMFTDEWMPQNLAANSVE